MRYLFRVHGRFLHNAPCRDPFIHQCFCVTFLKNIKLISGIIAGPLIKRFGWRIVTICGSVLSAIGFFTSSFAPNVYLLYFTYGALTGKYIGGSRARTPSEVQNVLSLMFLGKFDRMACRRPPGGSESSPQEDSWIHPCSKAFLDEPLHCRITCL